MSNARHYLYLNYNDSINIYNTNTPYDFIVELPNIIYLPGRKWICALVDIHSDQIDLEKYYIFIDFCESSYIRNTFLPVVRYTNLTNTFSRLTYVNITRDHIAKFRVYIRDRNLQIPSFHCESLSCTVVLRKQ